MTSKRHDREGADTEGKAVPPYEGRQKGRPVREGTQADKNAPLTGGATAPVEDDAMKAPEPKRTRGGATASPADEKAAGESKASERDTGKGTGPAHQHGVRRAEDQP